jgi:hypothetical protein
MPDRPPRGPVEQIRQLYYETTAETIHRDLARAIDLFKGLQTEHERERAAVFMDGLAQMRSEWSGRGTREGPAGGRTRPSRRRF